MSALCPIWESSEVIIDNVSKLTRENKTMKHDINILTETVKKLEDNIIELKEENLDMKREKYILIINEHITKAIKKCIKAMIRINLIPSDIDDLADLNEFIDVSDSDIKSKIKQFEYIFWENKFKLKPNQYDLIKQFRTLRNKIAHPSGSTNTHNDLSQYVNPIYKESIKILLSNVKI